MEIYYGAISTKEALVIIVLFVIMVLIAIGIERVIKKFKRCKYGK